ncbi:MAG TPA: hypothetical protein DEB06_06175 [Phycisphaerales bacterium]|nr:hypothetical protein [Phycisphaerales bacterium]
MLGLPLWREALAQQSRAVRWSPLERRVVVIPGRTLVVPLEEAPPSGEEPAVAWGSEPSKSRLVWFTVSTAQNLPVGWLPPVGLWSAEPRAEDGRRGFWALLVEADPRARGRPLRIEGRTVPTAWVVPPPSSIDAARLPPLTGAPAARATLITALAPVMADPFLRWRASLVLDRLGDPPTARAQASSDPVDMLARQNEDRWRVAIDTLSRDDADLAADLVARVSVVISSPDGALLPAWSLEESGLGALRDELLNPDSNEGRRASRARAWLEADAPAIAWVIDDFGGLSGAGSLATVAIANPSRTHAVGSLAPEGDAARNPTRIDGQACAVLRVARPTRTAEPGGPSRVIARAGGWTRPLNLVGAGLPASPPGLVIGPFLEQWTLASWRAGAPVAAPGAHAAAALLTRATDGPSWWLFIECRYPGLAAPPAEVVRVHAGPRDGDSTVLSVGPGAPDGPPWRADTGRWSAAVRVPIDRGADSVLLGLEHVRADEGRSSWPRAMMPGQSRGPGRAAIDLTRWGGLGAND